MRAAILSIGALVIQHKEQTWLFGAPEGIRQALDNSGIEVPPIVFTTGMRAPGYGKLGKPVLRYKESPLRMDGIAAIPISRTHGTDYLIESDDGKILYSERGDVSVADMQGYDLCVIKNKHVSNGQPANVLIWPWSDSEYILKEHSVKPITEQVAYKVWSSMEDVPDNMKAIDGAPLSVDQANFIARVAKASGGDKENWAIGISTFKKSYVKKDGKWEKRQETSEKEEDERPKLSQDKVKYTANAGKDAGLQVCANCEYYCQSMTCKMVDGDINPQGYCVLWESGYAEKLEEQPEHKMPEMAYMELEEKTDVFYNKLEKEMSSTDTNELRPVKRFGDVITAALHTAYNDVADHYFSEGALSQDERMEVAGAVGPALSALRNGLSEDLLTRDITYVVPIQLKELAPNVPDTIKTTWCEVYKDKNGNNRWASISSAATWDRQGEFFSTKAMDWAIGFAKLTGYKGPLRYRHIPGLDGGACDTQVRVGDFLFESGTFDDTPLGLAMSEKLKSGDWQISLGLAFAQEDLVDGIYQRAAIFERSMTQAPALPVTAIAVKEETMKIMSEEELKQAAGELGMELTEVKTMYERAIASGNMFSSKEETIQRLKETANAGGMGGQNAAHNEEDDEEMEKTVTKENLVAILNDLNEAEWKELNDALAEITEKQAVVEDEEEMDEEEEMPKKKTKSDERIDSLEHAILTQTKAIADLAAAFAGNVNSRNDVKTAVAELLSEMPREQSAKFVSGQTRVKDVPADEDVMAKLKAIEEQLKATNNPAGGIYSLFTSQKLNRGRGA